MIGRTLDYLFIIITSSLNRKACSQKKCSKSCAGWRVGRVGNCPPSFWQNRRRLWVAARRQWRATLLLAHPVLGSYLRLCSRNLFVCHEFQQWGFSKGTVRLYCVVDTGYGLGKSLGGLQTCIAGRSKVPNG